MNSNLSPLLTHDSCSSKLSLHSQDSLWLSQLLKSQSPINSFKHHNNCRQQTEVFLNLTVNFPLTFSSPSACFFLVTGSYSFSQNPITGGFDFALDSLSLLSVLLFDITFMQIIAKYACSAPTFSPGFPLCFQSLTGQLDRHVFLAAKPAMSEASASSLSVSLL